MKRVYKRLKVCMHYWVKSSYDAWLKTGKPDREGVILTSNNIYPLNLFFHAIGMFGWFIVSILWNDRALLVINAVSLAILINGLVAHYVK